ncbi:hypothetical protein RGQ29_026186 [Quercus rubra]|uniref:FAS1 domain-containing protein n=1 Tax=Quercus rubra TaxID=3512 RepID=A0AAN7EZT6_QUERU|nr:hypothetical protein RGQ29_026186 [Quercus rubra]
MMKQVLFPSLFFLIFLFHCTTAASPAAAPAVPPAAPPAASPAVSPAAAAPAASPPPPSSGPTDIIAILKKAGHFTTLVRLLKNTELAEQINAQVKKSSPGLTLFAPTDNAFSDLKLGTLNTLTDKQQLQLVQFHIIPAFYSTLQFQTATNPVHTLAGDSNRGKFPLNVTSSESQVNITTGVDSATVENTLYTSDGHLVVYQVDHVLLPMDLFGSASVLTPPKPEKSDTDTPAPTAETSGATSPTRQAVAPIVFGVGFGAIFSLWL